MESIRNEFSYVRPEGHSLAVFQGGRRVEWFTFAGGKTNDVLSGHLARVHGISSQANDLSVSFPDGTRVDELLRTVGALTPDDVAARAEFDEDAVEALKFHECLPPALQQDVLRRRCVHMEVLAETLSTETHSVLVGDEQRTRGSLRAPRPDQAAPGRGLHTHWLRTASSVCSTRRSLQFARAFVIFPSKFPRNRSVSDSPRRRGELWLCARSRRTAGSDQLLNTHPLGA